MKGIEVFRNTLVVLLTIALAYLFVRTLNIWLVLAIAILIASAVRPAIVRLRRWGLSQGFAILVVYGFMAAVGVTMLLLVMPPVVNQFIGFLQNDNRLANRLIIAQSWLERTLGDITGSNVSFGIAPEDVRTTVHTFVEDIRITAPSLLDDLSQFVTDFVLIFVMGIYWLTSREKAEKFILDLVPIGRQAQVSAIFEEIETGLGAYVRGIILVSFLVGSISYVPLALLNVPGAATISFIYGLATAIPIVGGILGVAAGTALALISSPTAALTVFLVTAVMQQVENYIISPRIMSRASAFDEILVIVFIAAGFTLNGIVGALIAIPVAGTVTIIVRHLVLEPRKARVTPVKVEGGILLTTTDPDLPSLRP
ncbi:MAG: AI-2E family transporter [bacterium]|nr:AI-2E family transporter [bacterium]